MKANPTLQEIVEEYKRFNAWEREEQRKTLPELTIEESLTQFFELCSLTRTLSPDASQNLFQTGRGTMGHTARETSTGGKGDG